MLPLWTKALHLIFMVTWFAGLFYLPRLFIYHVESTTDDAHQRFQVMERKLFVMMTIGAVLTVLFGLITLSTAAFSGVLSAGWFQLKMLLVLGLLIHHGLCWRWMRRLASGSRPSGTRGLRWFNEIPVFYLFAIILLAILRPF